MIPVSPVIPGTGAEGELKIAVRQPEYSTLPALRIGPGVLLTRWEFADEAEREKFRRHANVNLVQLAGGAPAQPTEIYFQPVASADEVLPPERRDCDLVRGSVWKTFFFREGAERDALLNGGHLYVVIWGCETHVQPLRVEADVSQVAGLLE